ncbi:alginate export family protein [Kozakia baliensis]|uniref:alginate export family protein n=1 Tax=Kozakia baliensis TaxID=153496 RepID=UPI000497F1EC|nr:alginate export family protein [Kozakia baliensis]
MRLASASSLVALLSLAAHQASAQTTLLPVSSLAPHSESLTVEAKRPAVQNYPHAGPVGQPRRVSAKQSQAPHGRQYDWGAFTGGNGESAGFGPVGRYGVAPWAEDWSFLRNRALRDDPFDPLKFIALNDSKSIWLSFSGETRLRNWYEESPFLGTRGAPGSGRFGVRNLYGADLHLGRHVRLFGQLINADSGGWAGYGYNSTYRKRLDLQQAFIELSGMFAGAKSGLIFGRQQFLDAPSYILYNRETPNVPLSWNGVRGYAIWPHVRVDAYDFVGTNINQNKMFHDNEDWGTRLHGLDVTIAPPNIRIGKEKISSYLDLFLIAFRVNGSSASILSNDKTLKGTSARQNYGFRWYGNASSFEFSVGGLYQAGTFERSGTQIQRSVRAYAFNAIAGYRHTPSPWHPFLGGQIDYYSGGDTRSKNGAVGTYIAPFNPQTNYLDTTTYIAPSNLISLSPVLRVTPLNFLSLQFKSPFFWRANTNDAIYSSSSAYSFRNLHGGFVGVVPQASLTLQINRHLTWTQYGARFISSNGLHAAGGKSGSYYQSNFVFRF